MELKELEKVDLNLRQLAINIVKYQNFKSKVALPKLSNDFKETTLQNYFTLGVAYIKQGRISGLLNKKIYGYIDEAIENHTQPLTPSKEDRRKVYNKVYTKKDAVLPVNKLLNKLKEENSKLTERFEYGVRVDDTVKIFKSREQADFFLEGVLFGNNDANNPRIVTVSNLGE